MKVTETITHSTNTKWLVKLACWLI